MPNIFVRSELRLDTLIASRLQRQTAAVMLPNFSKGRLFSSRDAQDPRPLTVHEGIPGHGSALSCLEIRRPNTRHYYDSARTRHRLLREEMMLQPGCSTIPHGGTHARNHLQFHASAPLRVGMDVKLASAVTLEQAGKYLQRKSRMDEEPRAGSNRLLHRTGQALTIKSANSRSRNSSPTRDAAGRKI